MAGRQGIMLAQPFEQKRLAKWNPPYIVQPKLDGERCRYVQYPGGSLLLSSQENPFFSVPHIKEYLDSLNLNIELDGELYCHGMPFEEIVSRVSREVNIHEDHKEIKYYIFDVATGESQVARTLYLSKLKPILDSKVTRVVPSYIANSFEDIMMYYEQFLKQDYEGIIVRHCDYPYLRKRSTGMMKFKPKKTDEYEIVGYTQEVSINGEPKQSLGALICKGDDGTLFNVGTGFTKSDREFMWSQANYYPGKKVRVSYQHLTHGNGVPRFPVFVEVI